MFPKRKTIFKKIMMQRINKRPIYNKYFPIDRTILRLKTANDECLDYVLQLQFMVSNSNVVLFLKRLCSYCHSS